MFEGAEGILESSVSLVLLSSSKTLRRPTSLPLVLATFSAFRSIVGSLWRTATVDVSWFLAGGVVAAVVSSVALGVCFWCAVFVFLQV